MSRDQTVPTWGAAPRSRAYEPDRPVTDVVSLTKSSSFVRLKEVLMAAQQKTGSKTIEATRRAAIHLARDWDDEYTHGFVQATLELVRDLENDLALREILVCILAEAKALAGMKDREFVEARSKDLRTNVNELKTHAGLE